MKSGKLKCSINIGKQISKWWVSILFTRSSNQNVEPRITRKLKIWQDVTYQENQKWQYIDWEKFPENISIAVYQSQIFYYMGNAPWQGFFSHGAGASKAKHGRWILNPWLHFGGTRWYTWEVSGDVSSIHFKCNTLQCTLLQIRLWSFIISQCPLHVTVAAHDSPQT